jgi:hypothetical protein
MFLDINRLPIFILNTQRFGDWILSPSSALEIGTSSIDCAQLSKFYLKAETESNHRNVVCFK